MKRILFLQFLLIFFLNACENGFFASSYQVELPRIPAAWSDILGSPQWRLEWISPAGIKETLEIEENQPTVIQVLEEWTTPVIAYPFWSRRDIPPDVMMPTGALVPFDIEGGRIRLSWRGGVDAVLYQELAAQDGEVSRGPPRYPHYFNWTRFRELLESDDIHEAVRHDPWSADWKGIAQKISQSGFDQRRIVPLSRKDMLVPIPYEGLWISTSPFADPIYQEAGTELSLRVCEKVDTYLSAAGMLRCTKEVWLLIPWDQ